MRDRLLSKSRTSDIPELDRSSERQPASDPADEDFESEREAEILLKTRVPETLQAIGDHLDRALAAIQRMERRIEEFTR